MRIAVLLSASRHPVSGRPALARVEAQAVALALSLGAEVAGFHAGPDVQAPRAALGHGLARLVHIPLAPGADPVEPLAEALRGFAPTLVLAGARSAGDAETGLVPYALAEALGWPIVADAAEIRPVADGIEIAAALPKGARLVTVEQPPLVLTVHPAAAPARPYAYAQERRGRIETAAPARAPVTHGPAAAERPMRQRAKVRAGATGGSAADRLRAATESTATKGGRTLVAPEPEAAARAILDHLRGLGLLKAPT